MDSIYIRELITPCSYVAADCTWIFQDIWLSECTSSPGYFTWTFHLDIAPRYCTWIFHLDISPGCFTWILHLYIAPGYFTWIFQDICAAVSPHLSGLHSQSTQKSRRLSSDSFLRQHSILIADWAFQIIEMRKQLCKKTAIGAEFIHTRLCWSSTETSIVNCGDIIIWNHQLWWYYKHVFGKNMCPSLSDESGFCKIIEVSFCILEESGWTCWWSRYTSQQWLPSDGSPHSGHRGIKFWIWHIKRHLSTSLQFKNCIR